MAAGCGIYPTQVVDQSAPIDRSDQLTLDVAGVIQPDMGGGLDLDVEGQTPPGGDQGGHDHEREGGTEPFGWAEDERRAVGCRLTGVGIPEIDQPEFVNGGRR